MRDRVEIWLIEHVAKIHDDTRSHYDVIVGNCAMAAQLFGFWMEHSPNYRHSRDIHISLFSSRNNRGSQSRSKLKYTNARQRSIRFTSVFALAARLIAADFNGDLNGRDFLSNSQRVQFIPMLWLISNVRSKNRWKWLLRADILLEVVTMQCDLFQCGFMADTTFV